MLTSSGDWLTLYRYFCSLSPYLIALPHWSRDYHASSAVKGFWVLSWPMPKLYKMACKIMAISGLKSYFPKRKMFSVTPVLTDARQISVLWIFTCGGTYKPRCMQLLLTMKGTSPSHCGCMSDSAQLLWHLWTDVAVHDETCRGANWISWRHFEHLL
jgi:hypothetical protein